jgi:hypothetical protein
MVSTSHTSLMFGLLLFATGAASAQSHSVIAGTLMDAETMLPIRDAHVIVNNERVVAITDNGGYFEMRLAVGPYLLEFRHVAYTPKLYPLRVEQRQGQMLLIELRPRIIQLPEVTVSERIDRLTLLDERNTYAVIRSDDIQHTTAASVRDVLMRLAPSAGAMFSAPGVMPNQLPPVLYLNGVRTESFVIDLIDPQTIDRVLIWRTTDAPVTVRTTMSRYVIDVRTKNQ